jgi:AcrR family transcriptional regulator
MTDQGGARPGPRDDRGVLAARILEAARTEFGEHGYAGTTMRGVARKSGVDPALVHHYFGSKDGLLEACIRPPAGWAEGIAAVWAGPRSSLGAELVRRTLANWEDPAYSGVMRAILLIAAHHPETQQRLRAIVANQLMGPAAVGAGPEDRAVRSGLVASQLIGLALVRYVWRIEPIASLSDAELVDAIGPTIQRYIDD